jgi:hypothetical protein
MPKVSIPEVDLNKTNPWDGSTSMLPPGEYVFQVEECVIVPPKKEGGHPQLEFDLTVQAGADSEQYNGTEKKHWLSLAPKAAGRVRNMLDACGVAVEADGSFDSDHFQGAQFIAEVYEESYLKPNLAKGTTDEVITNRIRKERPVEAGWSDGGAAPAAAQAPAAAAPAAAAPRAPAAKAPAAAQAAAPAAAAAPPPAAPAQPRVATGNPPRRPPIPPRRRS